MSVNTNAVTRAKQDAFLAAYSIAGSVRSSALAIDVPIGTAKYWIVQDTLGFKAKYRDAKEMFREYLQDLAVDRVQNQKPGDNPVLLITLLNAHWPEKYRRDAYHADNSAKEVMGEWKKWLKESTRAEKKKSGGATNADSEQKAAKENAVQEAQSILSRKGKSE